MSRMTPSGKPMPPCSGEVDMVSAPGTMGRLGILPRHAPLITALEDVENALVAYAKEQVRRQFLMEASQASQRAVDLARSQYLSGLTDFQIVLDAQRSLLSLKSGLAESEGQVTSNLIMLYKALGGGWTSLAP